MTSGFTDLCDEPEAEEMVVSSIRTAIEKDSQNPEAYQAKAAYHLIKEEFDLAKQEMKKSLDLWMPLFEGSFEGIEDAHEKVRTSVSPSIGSKLVDDRFLANSDVSKASFLEDSSVQRSAHRRETSSRPRDV